MTALVSILVVFAFGMAVDRPVGSKRPEDETPHRSQDAVRAPLVTRRSAPAPRGQSPERERRPHRRTSRRRPPAPRSFLHRDRGRVDPGRARPKGEPFDAGPGTGRDFTVAPIDAGSRPNRAASRARGTGPSDRSPAPDHPSGDTPPRDGFGRRTNSLATYLRVAPRQCKPHAGRPGAVRRRCDGRGVAALKERQSGVNSGLAMV
jgi:hypothetical protein